MNETKTAAVGEAASIVLFGAAGVRTKEASTTEEAEKAVASLVREGFTIIFLSERLAEKMPETLEKYRQAAYPLILPIPDRAGTTGYSMEKIRENMEKAIGTDIFADKN